MLSSQGTCTHTLSSRHRKLNDGARSALETCQQNLSRHMWTAAFDTCRNVCTLALLSTQTMEMQIHTHPSVKANRCKARSSLDTSRHVHKHDKLRIRACTRRPSMRACTCINSSNTRRYSCMILSVCRNET